MAKSNFKHTDEWFEQLIRYEHHELSESDSEAVRVHLETCPSCARTLLGDSILRSLLDTVPAPDFPPGLPPKLLQLWEKKDFLSTVKHETYKISGTRAPDGTITWHIPDNIGIPSEILKMLLGSAEEGIIKQKGKPSR